MNKLSFVLGLTLLSTGYQNCAKQSFETLAPATEAQSVSVKSATNTASNSNQTAVVPRADTRRPASTSQSQTQTQTPPANTATNNTTTSPVANPVNNPAQQQPVQQQPSQPAQPQPVVQQPQIPVPAVIQPVQQEDWQITSFVIEYDSKMKPKPLYGYSPDPDGTILEAGNRTLISSGSRVATYEEITGNTSLSIENPEQTSPTKATIILCDTHSINNCKTMSLETNKLSWSLQEGVNTSVMHTQFLCVNTGQSVSEKRGLIDCGAKGAAAFMLTDRDPSLVTDLVLPPRGTLYSYNTRGFAEGTFIVKATIPAGYPGLEKFAGKFAEYSVGIKNRLDLQLTLNTATFFDSYGIPLIEVNTVSSEGLNNSATFKSVSCVATTSNGQTYQLTKRQYENRFTLPKQLQSLPVGTAVSVDCSATTYDGQSATAKMIQYR